MTLHAKSGLKGLRPEAIYDFHEFSFAATSERNLTIMLKPFSVIAKTYQINKR